MKEEESITTSQSSARMPVAVAARLLGVCEQTVRNMASIGRLTWFYGSGSVRPSGLVAASVYAFIRKARENSAIEVGQ